MRFLIFGKDGQLGSEFTSFFDNNGYKYISLSKEDCDIKSFKQVENIIKDYHPDIVINCTAYNFVDKAEEEFKEVFEVNAFALKNIANICYDAKCFLIHYSTDYVFDGLKQGFYEEEDIPNPLNMYGKSKLAGEEFVKEILDRYLIFRTSWVYGKGSQNFLYRLVQWAEKNDILKIAVDEFSVPTSTRTIVNVTIKAIEQGLTGLYHLTNSGYASRYEWAKEFFRLKAIKKLIYPAYQSDFNLPAKRPKWSVMTNEKITKALEIEIVDWKDELQDFVV